MCGHVLRQLKLGRVPEITGISTAVKKVSQNNLELLLWWIKTLTQTQSQSVCVCVLGDRYPFNLHTTF